MAKKYYGGKMQSKSTAKPSPQGGKMFSDAHANPPDRDWETGGYARV